MAQVLLFMVIKLLNVAIIYLWKNSEHILYWQQDMVRLVQIYASIVLFPFECGNPL